MEDIAKLTYPQILMLNHASAINRKRMDQRIKKNRETGSGTIEERVADMPLINGRRLSELTSDEIIGHHGSEGPRPRVIKVKKG